MWQGQIRHEYPTLNPMKQMRVVAVLAFSVSLLLAGCMGLSLGGGTKSETIHNSPTLGQQLVDLQKAKDSGALTEAEFQTQKAKLLAN
jgi:hypothetical protein